VLGPLVADLARVMVQARASRQGVRPPARASSPNAPPRSHPSTDDT
jgi:hypothetical protein